MTLRAWIASLAVVLSSLAAGAALALDSRDHPSAVGLAVRTDAARLQLADVAPPPDPEEDLAQDESFPTGVPTPIDGRWTAAGGLVVELDAGTYQVYANGQPDERGVFKMDGDRLVTRSEDGRLERARITRQGNLILLEQDSGYAMVLRAETTVGTAPTTAQMGGPASVEGRWRAIDGAQVDLAGGQAVFRDDPGQEPQVGSYRIDNGELVAVDADGVERIRGPWLIIGDRLVVESSDAAAALVLVRDGVPDVQPAEPVLPPAAEDAAAGQAGDGATIDGRWQLGPGMVVEFSGGRYQAYEDGEATESGTVKIDGDRITLDEGPNEHTGRFTRAGDVLLLEPDDESPMLLRAESPSGAAPVSDPADLIGRWRTDEEDVVELLPGGRMLMHENGGAEEGGYRVEGDVLIIEEAPGDEARMRWITLGDRIVLEIEGDDEVIILTREPGAAGATQPSEAVGTVVAADEPPAELPAADQPVPVGAASAVEGRWVMGAGLIIEFAGGRYQVSENGQVRVAGTVAVEGETLLLHRDDDPADKIRRSRFTRAGDALLIEPEDDEPVLMFAETSRGTAVAPAATDIEGRWRSNEGELAELRGGRFVFFGDDGSIGQEGSYTVEGDTITLVSTDRTESWRWARLGERVALQQAGDDETIVLTPEPLVDTTQLPQEREGGQAPAPATPVQEPVQQPADAGDTPAQQPAPTPQREEPLVAPLGQQQPGQQQPVQPPPLPAPAGQLSDGTPLGEQWAGYLKGKRMVQGVGQVTMQLLDLCSDGRYVWLVGQGVETPRPQGTGTWSVLTQGPLASLQLTPTGAPPGLLQLDFDGRTAYLNRIPTQVLAMNQSCP